MRDHTGRRTRKAPPRTPPAHTIPAMSKRLSALPASLLQQSRFERLCASNSDEGIPALLAHPDWSHPAPVVIWMHGRTVSKEIDPGRYLRWIRAGVAACAIDLPGHGERFDQAMQSPDATLFVVDQALGEVDRVIEDLAHPRFEGAFDLDRLAIGGMSAGGMTALRRLADDHPFRAAAVESTAGDFSLMPYMDRYPADLIARLDPSRHIEGWRPIPLLALHSEADEWVPVAAIRTFIERLRAHYTRIGADPDLARLVTWPRTGAPNEHAGFGNVSNDAKNLQTEFLAAALGAAAPARQP